MINKQWWEITECQRCNGKDAFIMSMYNTDMICLECKRLEKERPDYKQAEYRDLMELADRVGGEAGDRIRKNAAELIAEG